MDKMLSAINKLMVDVFNDILTIEEKALKEGSFSDISITEVHTIEAIGMYSKNAMSEIAKKLGITLGTLTVAINKLSKKGYVERFRGQEDKRVVKIGLTNRGRLLYRTHYKFHKDLIVHSLTDLSEEDRLVLRNTLSNLHKFLLVKRTEKKFGVPKEQFC